jgi:hypothetical protein
VTRSTLDAITSVILPECLLVARRYVSQMRPSLEPNMPSRCSAVFVSVAILGLGACGGGDGGGSSPPPIPPTPAPTLKTGTDQNGTGGPGDPLSALTAQAQYQVTPHQGLEIVSPARNGLTPDANPGLRFERTTTGFDMTVGADITQFDTRANSRNLDGTNQYDSCYPNPSCVGSQVGQRPVYVSFNSSRPSTLEYTTYGKWRQVETLVFNTYGVFATGVPTTTAQMPTTGSGTFNGGATGFVVRDSTGDTSLSFNGTAAFTANFGTRTVTGTISAITADTVSTGAGAGTIGSISLTGTINGAAFSGTALGNPLLGAAADIGGATGTFGGQFYGPAAQEAAGSFALAKPDLTVIGSFGVRR